MIEDMMYLDHAAATPVDPVVLDAMLPFFSEKFFNPSSPYAKGVEVKHDYAAAKQLIAKSLGAQADELVMTAGATESINIAFTACQGPVLVSAVEHVAAIAAAERTGRATRIMPDKKGRITAEAVASALTPETTFVSIGLVNNELGTVQPIEDIGRVLEAERLRRQATGDRTPLLFHCDASQAAALIDIRVKRLGVGLLTLSAAKVYGPKQVGLLWVRPGVQLRPTVVGGGQESGLRSGTENVAGVVGFAKALDVAGKRRSSELHRLREIRDNMQRELEAVFSDMVVSSDKKKGLVNFLHVSFPGIDAERLIFWLETRGVMVATGSACAANKDTKSHVLEAIGLDDSLIRGSLRISLGRLSTDDSVRRATELIIEAVQTEKARMARS